MIIILMLALVASGYSLPLDKNLKKSEENSIYRLSENIEVQTYDLQMTIENLDETSSTFSGKVNILFKITKNLENLQLNAQSLSFTDEEVRLVMQTDPTISIEFTRENNNDVVTLKPKNPADEFEGNKTYLLTISYTGTLSDDMDGFYKSSYITSDNKTHYLASTQFESTSARKAFPCFDEPHFKAQFKVTIICPKEFPTVLSNGKEITRREDPVKNQIFVEFEETPKMSTYLLAFVISDFNCVNNTDNKFSVCSAYPEIANLGDLALKTAPEVLNVMKDYTNFDYFSEMKHLQQIAIPDFSAGAMENWGLVTYREVEILWERSDFSQNIKQKVVTVITHELSHQWFGDLVTLEWWDDTFLNEGFATYFEYHAAHQIPDYKEMELDKQFVVEQLQTALAIDNDKDNTLHKEVSTTAEIQQHFDSISYNKGGSILTMVESFLGSDNFKTGLISYIDAKKEQNAVPSDLWKKLSGDAAKAKLPNDTSLDAVMENWITKAGYPVISVKSNENKIILSQTPFSKEVADVKWYVPITFRTSAKKDNPVQWLTENELPIDIGENIDWVIVNDQETGYYRVNYDEALWNKLIEALSDTTKSAEIGDVNKAQIVDDLINLASAKQKEYKDVFKYLQFLKNEDSYYPWYAAINGFNNILKRINDDNVVQSLKKYILDLTTTLQKKKICEFTKYSSDNKHIDTLQKELVSKWLSDLGDETCVNAANAEFDKYLKDQSTKVDPNYRSAVYCAAVRKDATNSDKLWSIYDKASSAEQNIILKSLGCSSDPKNLESYLSIVVAENSIVRKQDARTAFTAVQTGSKEGISVVLDFIKSNCKKIVDRLGETALNGYISSVADLITNEEQQQKLEDISTASDVPESTKTAVTNAKTRVTKNLATTKDLETTFKAYFSSSANQNVIQYTTFISIIIVLLYQFL